MKALFDASMGALPTLNYPPEIVHDLERQGAILGAMSFAVRFQGSSAVYFIPSPASGLPLQYYKAPPTKVP